MKVTFPSGRIEYFNKNNQNIYADIKINNFSIISKLIKKGSVGFAESYMNHEFETNNLSNLIEITSRNIKVIYKFSGLLDFLVSWFLGRKGRYEALSMEGGLAYVVIIGPSGRAGGL